MKNRTPIPRDQRPPLPDFAPVPRKYRHDGWTPERQKAFIEALADTGSVQIACRMVNMTTVGAYYLRRQPGAEAFRRAWEAALDFGVQRLKDEAFERAMHGQLVPVFAAGKLMGFRRKKNDRLLMFCLRHYGQDAQGRRVTVNYFRSRASAESSLAPSGERAGGEGESGRATAIATAEAATATIQTSISPAQRNTLTRTARDDQSADILNAFEGVPLDEEAQAEIAKALAACAERRRATPIEDDPDEPFIHIADTNALYLGELESGFEVEDFIPFNPDEPRWQSLGEGGDAEAVAEIVKQIEAQRAEPKPADGEADAGA